MGAENDTPLNGGVYFHIDVGEAVLTTGGNLAATHVIHAAVMGADLKTDGEVIAKLGAPPGSVDVHLVCTPDSIVSSNSSEVKVWDAATSAAPWIVPTYMFSAAISRDGRFCVTGGWGALSSWDAASGATVFTLRASATWPR